MDHARWNPLRKSKRRWLYEKEFIFFWNYNYRRSWQNKRKLQTEEIFAKVGWTLTPSQSILKLHLGATWTQGTCAHKSDESGFAGIRYMAGAWFKVKKDRKRWPRFHVTFHINSCAISHRCVFWWFQEVCMFRHSLWTFSCEQILCHVLLFSVTKET